MNETYQNPSDASPVPSAPLRTFTKLLVGATLGLIFLGGQVKSHDAGLAVPDWPTTFGVNMFLFHWSNWVGGIFHEHVHRLAAATVGFLCIVLVVWLWVSEPRRWVRTLGYLALGAVILQGVLGGLTVIFLLPTPISTMHAVLAQTFFVLTIIIAYGVSKERAGRIREPEHTGAALLIKPAVILFAAVYVQLIFGALMRHMEAGLAIPDFPATGGRWLPWVNADTVAWVNAWRDTYNWESNQALEPVGMGQVLAHFVHRVGALIVLLATFPAVVAAYRARRESRRAWRSALGICVLVGVQVALGAVTVWTQKVPVITSLHVVTGAAALGLTTLLVLRACPVRWRQTQTEHEAVARKAAEYVRA